MAKRKKRLVFNNYDEAMNHVEKLKAKGDTESEEFEFAIESATQFFLQDKDAYHFNKQDENGNVSDQNKNRCKWLTLKELASWMGIDIDDK